ncbi:MAG: AAA family ATPase [Bacteroidales bacterium]|nr:AAA family ATPase [Bacteroidales bacterium]
MNEKRKQLIISLLQSYKKSFLHTPISADGANELYKWQLITDCKGQTEKEIIQNIKTKNIIDVVRDNIVLSYLLNEKSQQLFDTFAKLKDEQIPLVNRLLNFKMEMADLCDKKYNSKANDERTAAAFLACWNPQKYTFYKNELYKNYCDYIGEQPRATGEKYPHYLQLIAELTEIIRQDQELTNKFQNETKGLIQSDLLTAQNILWQMKDLMNIDENIVNDNFSFKEFFNAIKSLLNSNESFSVNNNRGKNFVWINAHHNFMASDECHYEFCADNTKKAGHDGKHVFVEVHFESTNHSYFENALINMDGIVPFKWSNYGFRINDDGFELKGNVEDIAEKAINELYELDKLIGKTIKQIINNMNTYTEIEKLTQLLQLKKNIILQGAPGTGKTYNTAALALSICGEVIPKTHDDVMKRYEELQKEGRIGFCTFHQSMDYEDFVEGIKPIKPDEGEMYYKVEDGMFKIMSKVATNPQQVKQAKTINSAFDDLIQDIIDGNVKNLPMKNGSTSSDLSVSSQLTIKWKTGNGNIDVNCVSKDRILKLCEVYDSTEKIKAIANINESIRNIIGGCNSSYYWAVANYILKKIGKENIGIEKTQNYVLIIDEINRGNVSKIFGELITLLETDKRLGGDHPIKVTLPYSKELFGVPSNLYIIGTMNTTDRSVGNIDYAVRRRFAFVTLKADRQILVSKYGEDSKQVQLFDSVFTFLNDDKKHPDMDIDDLMVGHSYFMADTDNVLRLKLEYEIIPLIREYSKDGIINVKKDALENAFNDWKTVI